MIKLETLNEIIQVLNSWESILNFDYHHKRPATDSELAEFILSNTIYINSALESMFGIKGDPLRLGFSDDQVTISLRLFEGEDN